MATSNYLKAVRDQYEAFPYPPRNPADEKVRLENSWHDFLELINIYCVGVLHHMDDPRAGLQALRSVLKDDGAMSLMLYGKYGRTGVYQLQELLRRINLDATDLQAKLANTKIVLDSLPKTNWFKRSEDIIGDHKEFGEAGVVDLLLHAQDRPFTVDELYDLVEGCGLHVIELIERGRSKYKVESYIRDKQILDRVSALPRRQQQAIAELIAGDMIVHNFYVARRADTVASLDDLRNVPFYFLDPPRNVLELIERSSGPSVKVASTLYAAPVEFVPGLYTRDLFKYLDGEHSLKEIFEQIRRDHGKTEQQLSNDELLNEFRPIYQQFNDLGWMLLRHRSVGKFRSLTEMQMPP